MQPKIELPAEARERGPEGIVRFYALEEVARRALSDGNLDEADALADELLKAAPRFTEDWNYGNAIFHGHMIRGLVALQRGNVADARRRLLASADTPGSPQLDSFGPSMALAFELLEQGQTDVVLEFLGRCKRFWEDDSHALAAWEAAIRAKGAPDFRPNVCY